MKRLNITLLIGLFLGVGVVAIAIMTEIDQASPKVFAHPVALLIVIGGCIAGSMISLPGHEILRIFKRTYYAIVYPKNSYLGTLQEILRIAINANKDVLFIERLGDQVKNAMLKDGLSLIRLGFKADDIRRFLEIKKARNEASLSECSVLYMGLAKMGPAFGLLGTLVGLIILLYFHMGGGDMGKVASSMGIALTATLYGVGLANLIFQPLGEYVQYNAEQGAALDDMVIEGVIQIKERKHPIYLLQALKAFMPREDYAQVENIMRDELAQVAKKPPAPKAGQPEQTEAA